MLSQSRWPVSAWTRVLIWTEVSPTTPPLKTCRPGRACCRWEAYRFVIESPQHAILLLAAAATAGALVVVAAGVVAAAVFTVTPTGGSVAGVVVVAAVVAVVL